MAFIINLFLGDRNESSLSHSQSAITRNPPPQKALQSSERSIQPPQGGGERRRRGMDKSCRPYADCTDTYRAITTGSTNDGSSRDAELGGNSGDGYLKQINRLSHKINKPVVKKSNLDVSQAQRQSLLRSQPRPPCAQPQAPAQQQSLQHQPPVYNVNKSDFRDVVQRLTGSPVHDRSLIHPPPIAQPRQASSRLQQIRPPPLPKIGNRTSPSLQTNTNPFSQPSVNHTEIPIPNYHPTNAPSVNSCGPFSPLPPFPTIHFAAESPVSAYMRSMHSSSSNSDPSPKHPTGFSPFSLLGSPRWNNLNQTQSQLLPPVQQSTVSSSFTSTTLPPQTQLPPPPSHLPFGCLNSPRSPYPLLSPSLFLSPNSAPLGFPQLPLSPSVPLSPKRRDL